MPTIDAIERHRDNTLRRDLTSACVRRDFVAATKAARALWHRDVDGIDTYTMREMEQARHALVLKHDDFAALRDFLAPRGYDGCVVRLGYETHLYRDDTDYDTDGDFVILTLSAHSAWEVFRAIEDDPHAYGACAGDSLARALSDLHIALAHDDGLEDAARRADRD